MKAPKISHSKFLVFETMLLAIAIMLYIRSPHLFILHYYNFVPFDQHLPTPISLVTTVQLSASMCSALLDSTYK